jgi:hypothetical protein
MQASTLVRALIATLSIVLVATALVGATWYSGKDAASGAVPVVGVPTGEYVNGVAVHRLPSITVTASRSEEMARMANEEQR